MSKVTLFKADEVRSAVADNKSLLLVHFGSPLASPCEFVHQELEAVSASLDDSRIHFAEVDLPLKDFGLIKEFRIEEVPTLVLFRGDEEVERIEKIMLPDELREFVELSIAFYLQASKKS